MNQALFSSAPSAPLRHRKSESIVSTPDGELNVVMEGTVTGNTMKGIWELVETGETGSWSAKKK